MTECRLTEQCIIMWLPDSEDSMEKKENLRRMFYELISYNR